jgi:glycogen debranching enzyme
MKIIQIIGTCRNEEKTELTKYLSANYEKEVEAFEDYVLDEINNNFLFTGDPVLDKSVAWAKAILAVNQHFIDGSIQPMPCPAEYNFYFTHDVLLTDLALVNFDLPRVKKDLQFIINHASEDYVIPHAYYWKDSSYKTELVTIDGWNHFWFIILSASYLQHSSDTAFAEILYPYVKKSLDQSLKGEKDGLMYAFRPDWWDIGRNYGPRSYMTILAVKSIKDFIFISESLNKNSDELKNYSDLAANMQDKLNEKLWSDERKYLINYYEDGSEDPHYYMGSLLGVYFDLLDEKRSKELVATAEKYLLDKKLGVYTVYPMDFHELIDFFKFAGNEAGDPFKYANGGIWPHANAWYALALMKIGEKEKALEFIKTTMTLDGIMNSPNGQPAMYEYRNSNFNNPEEYGEVDKPQFMWAAGWYLYVLNEYFK